MNTPARTARLTMKSKIRVLRSYGQVIHHTLDGKFRCLLRGKQLDVNRQHQFWSLCDTRKEAVNGIYDDLYETLWDEVSTL